MDDAPDQGRDADQDDAAELPDAGTACATAAAACARAAAAVVAPPEQDDALARLLEERLRRCEEELAAARARIEVLEKDSATSATLADLLREGSALHDGFAALIAASVAQALKETPAPVPPALAGLDGRFDALDGRVQNLERSERSMGARMDALEERLDGLEPRFNAEVGKAAASAVARILREEISRLAGAQD